MDWRSYINFTYQHTWDNVKTKRTDLLRDVVSDIHLLVVEKHTVDGLNGSVGSLGGLVMNETIALRAAVFVSCNLARQNGTECSESVVEGLQGAYQTRV